MEIPDLLTSSHKQIEAEYDACLEKVEASFEKGDFIVALVQLALAAVAVLALIAGAYLGALGAAMFLCTVLIINYIRNIYKRQHLADMAIEQLYDFRYKHEQEQHTELMAAIADLKERIEAA